MADPARGSIEIDAPLGHGYATITHFDTGAERQSACVSAKVHERDGDGRPGGVGLQPDMKNKKPRDPNRDTPNPPSSLQFEMIDGDLKSARGGYTFEDLGGGRTRVTYENAVDPGFFVPGPVRKKIAESAVKDLLSQLKARAESTV